MTTPRPTPTPAESWGSYRSHIESLVESCADYISRLQRSLDGEIAPDRHYFNEKAEALADVAERLVQRGQDAEWYLGECDGMVSNDLQGPAEYCTLPIGHAGDHFARPGPSVAEKASDRARRLASRVTSVSRRLSWLASEVDLRRPEHHGRISEQRSEAQELWAETEKVVQDARSLVDAVRAVDAGLALDARLAANTLGLEATLGDGGVCR
jgi:hypothetical protein